MLQVDEVPGGVTFAVRVLPGAKRDAVLGSDGSVVQVAVSAPADAGANTEAVVRLIAEQLEVPRLSVSILSGALSPLKMLRVEGVSSDEVLRRFALEEA